MMQSLNPQQLHVVELLAAGSNVTSAAEAVGIHRTTIHHWSRTSPDFRGALDTARYARAEAVQEAVADLGSLATNALRRMLQEETAPPHLRLKAALFVIQSVSKVEPLPNPEPQIESQIPASSTENEEDDVLPPCSAPPLSPEEHEALMARLRAQSILSSVRPPYEPTEEEIDAFLGFKYRPRR